MASMSSMLITEGNLRAAAGGFIGVPLPVMNAGLAANSPVFGMRNLGYIPPGQLVAVNRPIAISQLRLKFATDAVGFAVGSIRLEAFKTDSPAGNYTGGGAVLAQRKKTTGYVAIPATEIDAVVSTGAALTDGGAGVQDPQGTAFDSLLLTAATGALGPYGESVWWPEDGVPLVIEQNEGFIVRATVPATGTWTGFIGFDFFRF